MSALARLTSSVVLLSLCGCAAMQNADKNINTAASSTNAVLRDSVTALGERPKTPRVTVSPGVWLGNQTVALAAETRLPTVFRNPVTFKRQVANFSDFAERVTQMTGVPVRATRDVFVLPAAGQPATFDYHGSLAGLFDTAASRFGASWRYRDGAVEMFLYDTRTFTLQSVPGDALNDTMVGVAASTTSNGGGGTGSGSTTTATSGSNINNTQNTQMTSKLSVWKGIEDTVKAMLSEKGKAVVSQATSTVTVTDTPAVLDRIGTFIDKQNRFLTRQVSFQVRIYAVLLAQGDEYGLDWNLLYKSLNGNFGIALNSFNPQQSSMGSTLASTVLNTATGNWAALAGTDLIVRALAEQGRVTQLTSATLTTLNNKPVPLLVGRETTYLAQVSTTSTANVGNTQSLQPGVVNSGYSINLLPNLAEDGSVYLQFTLDIRDLQKLNEVRSGDARIQTPEVARRSFLQQVMMRSGETLLLSGFEQVSNTLQNQGVGNPANILLGGSASGQTRREVIVVTVVPVVSQRN